MRQWAFALTRQRQKRQATLRRTEDSVEAGEAKALGDDTTECTETTRRCGGTQVNDSPSVATRSATEDGKRTIDSRLGVAEALAALVPLPDVVTGTGVVCTETFNGDVTVVALAEELGPLRRVGKKPPNERAEGEGDSAHEDEDGLVGVDTTANVADTVGEQRTEDGSARVCHLPRDCAVGLLTTGPPHLGDHNERGKNGGFESTQEEASSDETGKVVRGGRAASDDTPGDHVEHHPVLDGEDNEGVRGEWLKDELGNIDNGGDWMSAFELNMWILTPRVLLLFQVGGFSQVENGSVRNRRLVELLNDYQSGTVTSEETYSR